MLTRRKFIRTAAVAGFALGALRSGPPLTAEASTAVQSTRLSVPRRAKGAGRRVGATRRVAPAAILPPSAIPKYQHPLIVPPAMPRKAEITLRNGEKADCYEIAVRQFEQQVLPVGLPKTTVWSFGAADNPATFNYPAFTIEAIVDRAVRVKWINDLKDASGKFLPHLLPIDQTIHWANPPGPRDDHGHEQEPYRGPVPWVTHVHGAHTTDDSDGFTEAWYLPAATNIPEGYFEHGTWYEFFRNQFFRRWGVAWEPGTSVFQYPNDQRPATLWYHDHVLGMTRANVYAGPAGFYLLRGGPNEMPAGALPGPAPMRDEPANTKHYEIPIAIQDRTFNTDGSLFYPDNRAFFEGLEPDDLRIPFHPEEACGGEMSDIAPIWNPEFFGNTIVVNGRTWPYLEVERRRYRFRLLNGCNSRFLILKLEQNLPFWVIGSDGGYLPQPVQVTELLMAPAERYDVIVDFSSLSAGAKLRMLNLAPDEPFGGGQPGVDFPPADPQSTGQVMEFRVVAATSADTSTPPAQLTLPARIALGPADRTRRVSLNEEDSETVFVREEEGDIVLDCDSEEPFGPREALLGTVDERGHPTALGWDDPITENPPLHATETWEIWNFTMDAHPIHIHEIMFEVVDREVFTGEHGGTPGAVTGAEQWERGLKDTVIAYPGQITRVKGKFDLEGLYVWHCHIVEHEDNEMMRPYVVGRMPRRHRLFMPAIPRR